MTDSMEVGDRLREARERCGMTQGELAAKMGVNIATVTLWENRKNRRLIGTKHLAKAAAALGMRVSELLGETEQPEPHSGITTTDLAEEQLLRLFRLMPQKTPVVSVGAVRRGRKHRRSQSYRRPQPLAGWHVHRRRRKRQTGLVGR